MPALSGDEGNRVAGNPSTWLTVTHLQYQRLKAWADGNFTAGVKVASTAKGIGRGHDTPANLVQDLVRVPLEACVGGAFYPGIEITVIARHPALYAEAFRINPMIFEPGDITNIWRARASRFL